MQPIRTSSAVEETPVKPQEKPNPSPAEPAPVLPAIPIPEDPEEPDHTPAPIPDPEPLTEEPQTVPPDSAPVTPDEIEIVPLPSIPRRRRGGCGGGYILDDD